MDATEFACTLEGITKSLNIEIDSDIVGKMFNAYEKTYENYTLLELIGLLYHHKIKITCPWNKKALIKMIEDKNLNIPVKKEPMTPTKWDHYRVRRSLDVIETKYMEFYEGSIVQMPDGKAYIITDIYLEKEELISDDLPIDEYSSYRKIIIIYFEDMETIEESSMYIEDFMHSLDFEDTTILQDRNREYFMNEEQKTFWKNYVRWM